MPAKPLALEWVKDDTLDGKTRKLRDPSRPIADKDILIGETDLSQPLVRSNFSVLTGFGFKLVARLQKLVDERGQRIVTRIEITGPYYGKIVQITITREEYWAIVENKFRLKPPPEPEPEDIPKGEAMV